MVTPESKTAFITGAASGIGLETVRRFAEDPRYNPIFAVDRHPSINQIFQASEYSGVIPVQIDIRDREGIDAILRKIALETGYLDVVVNAAGMMIKGGTSSWFGKGEEEFPELKEMNEVNFLAPFLIMHKAAEIMRGRGGTIVNVTSAKYLFPDMYHVAYQRGKEDLSRATKRAAKVFKNNGIRVIDLQPGNTKTNIDRGDWTEEVNGAETEVSQAVAEWWRDHFGNDPRHVAEIIHRIADGKVRGTTVPVGTDAKVGSILNFVTYPLAGYRWDSMFFLGSTVFYQLATLGNRLRVKLNNQ